MEVDFILVGQGICGSFLSYYLLQHTARILIIDESRPFTATKVASGVINPVTGRRVVTSWMIEELLPFSIQAYEAMGRELQTSLIRNCPLLDFHPTLQMKEAFQERMQEGNPYLSRLPVDRVWEEYFRYYYGIGSIAETQLADLAVLLKGWREILQNKELLREEKFEYADLHPLGPDKGVSYRGVKAGKIIFCEGVQGAENPFFDRLPFVKTKGEALIVSIPGLPQTQLYKQGITLVPWKEGLFWAGSSYEWNFTDAFPGANFRKRTEEQLKNWLKVPFTVLDHIASLRPANLERRPFVGFHPHYPAIGLFNGMGTKGCSLAPYFADQFARQLIFGTPLLPQVDIRRFERTLLR